jgi:hypothetical protein
MKSQELRSVLTCALIVSGLLGCGYSLTKEEPAGIFHDAEAEYGEESYDEAIMKYEDFLRLHPGGQLERKATVRIWLCQEKRLFAYSKYQNAATESLLKDFPHSTEEFRRPEEDPSCLLVVVDEFNTFRVGTASSTVEAPSEQELWSRLHEARRGDSSGNIPVRLLVQAHPQSFANKVIFALDAGFRDGIKDAELEIVEDTQ